MEDLNELASTFWGSYLNANHQEIGILVAKKLIKHWSSAKLIYGNKPFRINKPYQGEFNTSEFEQIVKENLDQGYYDHFDVAYHNPIVNDKLYLNWLKVSRHIIVIEEYEGSLPFQTENRDINRQRTEKLLEVMLDIAEIPELRELWIGNQWNAFIGEPSFLYRPWELYEKVQDTSVNLTVKDEVLALTKKFQQDVPQEVIMEYLTRELGKEKVKEVVPGKILIRFYEEELMNRTVDVDAFLKDFQAFIDHYTRKQGIHLHEG